MRLSLQLVRKSVSAQGSELRESQPLDRQLGEQHTGRSNGGWEGGLGHFCLRNSATRCLCDKFRL